MATTRRTPLSYDDIEIPRPQLARAHLALIDAQPGRPLAMFAPRRVGKTFYLDHDLAPAARAAGWLPVYADLWLQKSAPLAAVNHALEEALDDAAVPATRTGRVARTAVKKIAALGASIDLGDTPARRALPAAPELRLDALVARLASASGRRVLLLLDEIQALADGPGSDAAVAALRAVLHQRRERLAAVFTGSSQEALARMLATAGAPMYQFAQLLDFPVLGDDYLQALADHFARVHAGKRLALDDLRRVWARVGHKPRLMKDLVKALSAEGQTDVDEGVRRFLQDEHQTAVWSALLQPLELLDRAVLHVLARGLPPLGRETLDELARLPGGRPTLARVRAAIERLRRAGLVTRRGSGVLVVEDALFAEFLQARRLEDLR